MLKVYFCVIYALKTINNVENSKIHKNVYKYLCGYVKIILHMKPGISDLTNIWNRTLDEIKEELNNSHLFDSFFKDSYIYSADQNTLYVVASSRVAASLLSTKYIDIIDKAVLSTTQTNYKTKFITKEEIKTNGDLKNKIEKETKFFKDSRINPKYTFDNFVVGLSNREAQQASLIVSTDPGTIYNPDRKSVV